MSEDRGWKVRFAKKAAKQKSKLPQKFQDMIESLKVALEKYGPIQREWPNFSALNKKELIYHCHINRKGHPTYVAVWQVVKNEIRLIEIDYVGTRENAPY